LRQPQGLRARRRFTPTGVGTIATPSAARPCPAVHPHGRGDNTRSARSSQALPGSPPRAWGQYPIGPLIPGITRFTPTGVGTIRKVVQ